MPTRQLDIWGQVHPLTTGTTVTTGMFEYAVPLQITQKWLIMLFFYRKPMDREGRKIMRLTQYSHTLPLAGT